MNKNKRVRLAIIFCLFFHATSVWGMEIKKIIAIESGGNSQAHNKHEDARGLMQIRACVLKEWNNYHPGKRYNASDLFIASINIEIGTWYMEVRVPQMLKHFNIEVTDKSKIVAYNAGILAAIKHYRDGKELPPITKQYLRKYFKN